MMRAIVQIFLAAIISFQAYSQGDPAAFEEVFSSAGKLLEDGSYKQALLDYTKLINSGYDNNAIWVKRGLAHYYLKEYDQALNDFNEAFKRQVRSPELLGYRALSRYFLEDESGATTDFEQAFAAGFRNIQAALITGNTYFQSADYTQAIKYYDLGDSWGSDDPVLFNNRGKARLLGEDYSGAIADFNRAIQLKPDYDKARSNRAQASFLYKKFPGALEDLLWLDNDGSYQLDGNEFAMLGIIRLQAGEYEEAATNLESALKRQSDLPGLYRSYGMSLAFTGKADKAIQMLEVSLDKEGKDTEVTERLAVLYYDKEQYASSLKYSEDALQAGSKNPDMNAIKGLSLFHRGSIPESLSALTASASATTYAEVHGRRAEIYFDSGNYDEALEALKPVAADNDPSLHAIRAKSLFGLTQYEKANAAFDSWKQVAPEEYGAWVGSARTLMILGEYQTAEKDIARALALDGSSFEVNALYGEVLLMNKEYEKASGFLEKALLVKEDVQVHAFLGMARSRLAHYDKAFIHLKKAADENKLSPEGLYDLAFSALETGHYDEALQYASSAVTQGLPAGRTLCISGLASYYLGDAEQAVLDLTGAVNQGNNDVRVLRALGQVELSRNNHKEAVKWFDRVLASEEEVESRLGRGMARTALGEYTAAVQDFSKILESDKDHDKARYHRGLALFHLGEYEKAPADLLLVNNKSLDLQVNEMIALSYARTGHDRALEYLEKAIGMKTEIPDIYMESGRILAGKQDWEKSLARLDLADKMGAKNADLYEVRGLVLYHSGLYERSLKDLSGSGLNKRLIGLDYYHLNRYAEALTALGAVTERDLDVLIALGDSYFQLDQREKAKKIFDEIIAAGDGNATVFFHRGLVRAGAAEWSGAIEDYRKSLSLEPGNGKAILGLAQALYQLDRFEELIRLFEENRSVNGLMAHAAMAYYATGKREQAKSLLEELVRAGNGSAITEAALGHIYHEEQSHEKAVESLTRAIRIGPADNQWKAWKALSLFALKKYDEARTLLDEVLANGLESGQLHYAAGVSGYENGDEEYTISHLDKAIALGDIPVDAQFVKANALYKLGRYDEAVSSYDKAVTAGYEDPVLWNNRGKALSNLDKWEESITSYDKAIAMDPAYLRALENRGRAHFRLENYKQASGDLRQVINLDEEEDGSVRLMLADTYVALGEDRQAIIFYGEAERRGQGNADLFFRRGACYARIEDMENALSDLNQAYGKGKQDAELFLERANVQIRLENVRGAMSDLNEAIAREQDHANAYFNRGYLHELNENFNEAISDYSMAIKLNPEDDIAWYSLANSMVSQGNVAGALKPIDEAIALQEKNGTYHKVRGNILYRVEQIDAACSSWKKAVELGDTKAGYYISQYCD